MKYRIVSAIATALALGLSACGGSADSGQAGSQGQSVGAAHTATAPAPSSSSGSSSTGSTGPGGAPTPSPGASGSASRGSSPDEGLPAPAPRHERYPHGDTSIQTYGHQGASSDQQQIAGAVERFYAAVAADDGSSACSQLSGQISHTIVQTFARSPQLQGKGCSTILGLLFKHRPGASTAHLTETHVTSVRVNGDKAFALLHSKLMPHGEIPMLREGGAWKVNAISGSELP